MKITLLLPLLFCIPTLLSAQEKFVKIDLKDTEYLYLAEKAFLKKTGKPLAGNYEIKLNRYQTEKSSFIDGLKEGESKTFRNNKLTETGFYKKDLREGEWKSYWEDGRLWKVTPYKNGLREGLEKVYSGNKLTETINYKLNHQDGLTTKFRLNGQLESQETFLKDKLIDTSYYYRYGEVLERKCFNGADTSFCINYNRATDVKVLDTIFFNKDKKPVVLKAYKNDTLKLKMSIDYHAVIKDVIDKKVTKVEVYEDGKLHITYYFEKKYGDNYSADEQVRSLLRYKLYYYTKPERSVLTVTSPDRDNYDKTTFYLKYPDATHLTRVEYNSESSGDQLAGWYHRDLNN
ncbi:hypothetical protein EZJ43_13375 [Pedobacter changchengzhani]|uniref:Toxin-antitoxin system YwqK family antitoxin n=1 Tax=Pedobacter changchengzhani TaxID=2529274 RepID=A0A4R5MK81_9SPHI|nr:hypothetical protein [Pedobacter changchengzhani]TDG35605.1 hypothetical protein EZJ43_13375 [Pedobacter changchengzhani]